MKDFISKNWKKLFYIVGVIIIVVDLFFIITTPPSVSEDFLEYGPTVENDFFDNTTEFTENIELPSGSDIAIEDLSTGTGVQPDFTRVVLIFCGGLAILIVLSFLLDGSGDSGGKKK